MSGSRQYASGTYVGIGRTKDEIERELERIGVNRHAFYDDKEAHEAVIQFERAGIRYRILLPLPDPKADKYRFTETRRWERDDKTRLELHRQDVNERWRALGAYIKALRVGWEAGILKIETVLLANVVLPDGQTVAEYVEPQVRESYRTGQMPPMIPGAAPAPKALPAPAEMRIEEAE